MNLRYNQFLLEKSFIELLLESKIKYFTDFTEILASMKSPVAKEILALNGKDFDFPMNYIDKTEKDDTVSFFIDNKTKEYDFIAKVVNPGNTYTTFKALSGAISDWEGPLITREPEMGQTGVIIKKYTRDEILKLANGVAPHCSVYHFRSGGKDYLIGESGIEETTIHKDGSKSQELKIGRFANKILQKVGVKFADKDIESFTNEFKSKVVLAKDKFSRFEIVKGELIREWYNEKKYDMRSTSTLQTSCMRYEKCGKYLNIYTENKVCELIILKSNINGELITGRALLWTLTDGTTKFMDRIYYSKDSEIDLFIEFAKSKGFCYKKRQVSSTNEDILFDTDRKYEGPLEVQLENYAFDYYPYVDTIKHFNPSTGLLSNTSVRNKTKVLESVTGGNEDECETCGGDETVECYECGGSGNYDCEECNGRGEIECNICEGDGDIECRECEGDGEIENSDGSMSSCEECNGKGRTDCEECDSKGECECSECNGKGEIDCRHCDGEGNVPCPDCQ